MNFQPVHPPVPSKNGIRLILSVDDEPGILFARQVLLENAAYKVLSTVDGEQALHLFSTQAADLVILDYVMPGMNGGVVARKMKIAKPLVPVIMVSANPVSEDILIWVDHFIRKGEQPELLLEKIEQLLAAFSTRQSVAPDKSTTDGMISQRKESDG